jgi:hypothetical protein
MGWRPSNRDEKQRGQKPGSQNVAQGARAGAPVIGLNLLGQIPEHLVVDRFCAGQPGMEQRHTG